MTTPERSVEEIFQHALDSIVFNHNPIEYDKQFGKLVEGVLADLIQAERQKREEIVEATVAKAIELTKQNVPYVTGDQERLIAELKALTQPNNPKV